ncbi:MAG: DNA mismatch repair protein MutS, partial [Bacteroidales bacterium]|nr:DNA mismatch repair protein MutS [Bacteroidales bacterium]
MAKKIVKTPLMGQYLQIKAKHPDAILLFRVGDFYETFSDDAILSSKILGITLTKRANGAASFVELAGFPHHSLDTYLPKLVRAGQRVAICEQLEDPKATKTLVKRGVTELVTPGVSLNDNIIENKENNFLASVLIAKNYAGVAFLDISTGEFSIAQGNYEYIDKLLNSLNPKEILYERSQKNEFEQYFGQKFYTYPVDEWMFVYDSAHERLLKQFDTQSLKGFGVESINLGLSSAGSILHYLDLTQHNQTKHITKLSRIDEDNHVWLDKFTIRNLELFRPMNEDGKSLIEVLDNSSTPMGSRLLKKWLALPLKNPTEINKRHEMVEFLTKNNSLKEKIAAYIKEIGDLERLASKVSTMRISPRELVQLKNSLNAIIPIIEACDSSNNQHFKVLAKELSPCDKVRLRITKEINDDAPVQLQKGNVIATSVNEELDELRNLAYSGKDYLAKMQETQALETGITSLKIGFNSVFGYYFEVRNTHKDRVPESWIRKQTLVSAERYINEELKEYESKILGAEEKIQILEAKLYQAIVQDLSNYIVVLQKNAYIIAKLDILHSFAFTAIQNNYTRPYVDDSDSINIKKGRHPVIEKQLPIEEEYIPNNVKLDTK